MLNLISEAAAGSVLDLVSIDPGTIVFTLINTLIIFLIFRIFLFKPVCNILDKRKEMTAAEIVKQANLRAQAREEEIIAEANAKAAEIRAKAEEAIERDKKRAMNEIKDEISEIVIMAATKVVEKEISEKDNEDIISRFLANVGTAE